VDLRADLDDKVLYKSNALHVELHINQNTVA
jgi:hypothetical protein